MKKNLKVRVYYVTSYTEVLIMCIIIDYVYINTHVHHRFAVVNIAAKTCIKVVVEPFKWVK